MHVDEIKTLKRATENQIRAILEDLANRTAMTPEVDVETMIHRTMGGPDVSVITVRIDLRV